LRTTASCGPRRSHRSGTGRSESTISVTRQESPTSTGVRNCRLSTLESASTGPGRAARAGRPPATPTGSRARRCSRTAGSAAASPSVSEWNVSPVSSATTGFARPCLVSGADRGHRWNAGARDDTRGRAADRAGWLETARDRTKCLECPSIREGQGFESPHQVTPGVTGLSTAVVAEVTRTPRPSWQRAMPPACRISAGVPITGPPERRITTIRSEGYGWDDARPVTTSSRRPSG
jgi:hypothetical protein